MAAAGLRRLSSSLPPSLGVLLFQHVPSQGAMATGAPGPGIDGSTLLPLRYAPCVV
jgi:hypothetical protein